MVYPLMIKKVMMKSGWFKDIFIFRGYIEEFKKCTILFIPKIKNLNQNY